MTFTLARGQVVLDLYRVVQPIKTGATSEVYKISLLEDSLVQLALKLARETDQNCFLEAECEALLGIRHPRVVGLKASGTWQGRRALVLDYHPRCFESLVGRVSLRDGLRLAEEILRGLLAIHAGGWAHYDVKPANMLLSQLGQGVVADLSLAMPARKPLSSTRARGTPKYMAPEACTATGLDKPETRQAADLYGWGLTLYELITGRLPWDNRDSAYETMRQHAKEDPCPPSSFKPTLPRLVDQLVTRAIARDPRDRFPSSEALLNALVQASQAVVRETAHEETRTES